jgi:hypothetical protein
MFWQLLVPLSSNRVTLIQGEVTLAFFNLDFFLKTYLQHIIIVYKNNYIR